MSVCLVAVLSVGMIVYHVGKEYKKIIEENFSVLDSTLESHKHQIEIELENGIWLIINNAKWYNKGQYS